MARFLLLHSPLVGPRSLSPLVDALRRLGHKATAPDLRSAVSASGLSQSTLRSVADQSVTSRQQDGPLIVVVHSGAGAYLPLMTELRPAGQVLVDAVVPPDEGTFTPSADFRSELERLVEADRHLPPWPQWWGEDAMARLVPDPELRAGITSECPRLPISFYDTVIDTAPGWARPWTGYLRLSAGYEPQARVATERGWPVRRRAGGHLDTATEPDQIAIDLVDLIAPVLDTPPVNTPIIDPPGLDAEARSGQ